MLDIVWHLRGSAALDGGLTNETALDRVEHWLEQQGKPGAERGPDHVIFDIPFSNGEFRKYLKSWNTSAIYDRGHFWIEQGLEGRRLRWDLRSLHTFVLSLIFALMLAALGLASNDFAAGLTLGVASIGWFYGFNVLLALARVPRSVRKALRAV